MLMAEGLTNGQLISLIGVMALIGQGFFFGGILWNKVSRNERDLSVVFKKLDTIEKYVKNGRK